jgi:hypothetical protein
MAGCDALHESIHGHPRTKELGDALATGTPIVALRDGRVRIDENREHLSP